MFEQIVVYLFDQDDWRYASGGRPSRAQETRKKIETAESALSGRTMATTPSGLTTHPQFAWTQQSRVLARALSMRQGNDSPNFADHREANAQRCKTDNTRIS